MVSNLIIPHRELTDDLELYVSTIADLFPCDYRGVKLQLPDLQPVGITQHDMTAARKWSERQALFSIAAASGNLYTLYNTKEFQAAEFVRLQIRSGQVYTREQFKEFQDRNRVSRPHDLVGMAVISVYQSGMLVGLIPVKHSIA